MVDTAGVFGYNNKVMKKIDYDILICGGGPAGLTAAVYAARAGMKTAILEGTVTGGQAAITDTVENYPGFKSVGGFALAENMREQAEGLGAAVIYEPAVSFALRGKIKKVTTSSGAYTANTVILAMGASPRRLGLENEGLLKGRGVSYCATCDGAFYRGKDVIVAGGGNTAAEDALYLARIANRVWVVHRRDALRADKVTADKVVSDPKITVLWDSVITELTAEKRLTGAVIKNVKTGLTRIVAADALFVAVGQEPATKGLTVDGKPVVKLDANGYIWTNEHMNTNIRGVFAAGDIRNGVLKQIVTACADGAVAADSAIKYLQ